MIYTLDSLYSSFIGGYNYEFLLFDSSIFQKQKSISYLFVIWFQDLKKETFFFKYLKRTHHLNVCFV